MYFKSILQMGTCEGPIDPRPLTPILLVIDLEELLDPMNVFNFLIVIGVK